MCGAGRFIAEFWKPEYSQTVASAEFWLLVPATLVGIEKRVECYGNIQRFQPLNPLAITCQCVVYVTLQRSAFGAVCRYYFSVFVPIMRLYRNAERNGFVGALMRKADCQRGLAVFVDDFVSADCFDFHLFAY